jgi:hypothetical protein
MGIFGRGFVPQNGPTQFNNQPTQQQSDAITMPTPLLYPEYTAAWANGSTLVSISLSDQDVPLVIACADTPLPGNTTNLDLTTATSITFLFRASGAAALAMTVTAGALSAANAAYLLLASDVATLGVGTFHIGVQAIFSGGPSPVFDYVVLEITNAAP